MIQFKSQLGRNLLQNYTAQKDTLIKKKNIGGFVDMNPEYHK